MTIPPAIIARASSIIPVKGAGDTVGFVRPKPSTNAANANRRASPWDFWLSALVLGLAFATLAWGVYIASRVLRFPDITPDGSFPLGAAVAATLIIGGADPFLATVAAFFAGMAAGWVTGVLHTRLRVTELLAGILVMTALYSVNLHVMGRSNISLLDRATLATRLHSLVPATTAWPNDLSFGTVFLVLMLVLVPRAHRRFQSPGVDTAVSAAIAIAVPVPVSTRREEVARIPVFRHQPQRLLLACSPHQYLRVRPADSLR